jgi:hypothetical protein
MNDLHSLDPAAEAWFDAGAEALGNPPRPRWGHGLAAAGGRLYVFGGQAKYDGVPRARGLPRSEGLWRLLEPRHARARLMGKADWFPVWVFAVKLPTLFGSVWNWLSIIFWCDLNALL